MMECNLHSPVWTDGEPGVPVLWLLLDTNCFCLFRTGVVFVIVAARNEVYVIVRNCYIIEHQPGWALYRCRRALMIPLGNRQAAG